MLRGRFAFPISSRKAAAGLMAGLVLLALLRPTTGLIIADEQGQQFFVALNDGGFLMEFVHSVERTPVREVFHISRGRIILSETYYKSMGAGLPTSGEGFAQQEDWFCIKGMNRDLGPKISVGTWPFTKHVLVAGGNRYMLSRNTYITYQIAVIRRPWILWRDIGGATRQKGNT